MAFHGRGEAVAAAADGLWLNWVLGLVPVDQARMTRVRTALERLLVPAEPAASASKASSKAASKPDSKSESSSQAARTARKRPGGRRS